MRRSLMVLAAASAAAACGGHTAPPATTSAPSPRGTPPTGDPTSLRYGPGTGRYRVEQSQHVAQEVMGQTTEANGSTIMLVSAALTAGEAGNLAATFTVDSITATSSLPEAIPALTALRGKTFRAVFTPRGQSVTFTPPDPGDSTLGGGDVFREFLPLLPSGALTPGTTWTDTNNQTPGTVPRGMTMRTQSIRQHRVAGWEDHDGVRALKISTSATYTISGSGEAQGQQVQLTGAGTSTVDRYVSALGVYLGATMADSASLTVNVTSVGIEVPIRQTRRYAVTRLP